MAMQPSFVAQPGTQADEVFETLRAEILSCRLPPSAKIRINEIALRLVVSPGAVREALSRLSAEGMTVAEAQKGYLVASVSVDELLPDDMLARAPLFSAHSLAFL